MPDTIGECKCLYPFNKGIILEALGKEDTRLFSEINRLQQEKEKLGEKFVEVNTELLQKQRGLFGKVRKIVADTPECK